MKTDTPKKKSFRDICIEHEIENNELQEIAENASVAKSIVDTMFVGTAVERSDAGKVLAVLSAYIGQNYTFENVDVPVIGEEQP